MKKLFKSNAIQFAPGVIEFATSKKKLRSDFLTLEQVYSREKNKHLYRWLGRFIGCGLMIYFVFYIASQLKA